MIRNIPSISILLAAMLTACQSLAPVDESQKDESQKNVRPHPQLAVKQNSDNSAQEQTSRIKQETINNLVDARKYSKALALLESIPDKDRSKKDRNQITRIQGLAEDYDKQQSDTIEKLYEKGEKNTALRMLNTALENFPDGARLFYIKDKIEKEMSGYTRNIESQLLIVKGEWLLQRAPLLQELSKVKPGDKQVLKELENNRNEIIQIASKLTTLGMQAISADNLDQADIRLNMANTLNPTSENISALTRLEQLRHERKLTQRKLSQAREERKRRDQTKKMVQSQKRKQEQLEKATTKLMESVKRSLAKGNLQVANAQFVQLKKLGIRNNDIDSLQQNLDRAVKTRVKQVVEKGRELYSNGNIEQAISLWQTALDIDPENLNIKKRIQRASQVLTKLRELQYREGSETSGSLR